MKELQKIFSKKSILINSFLIFLFCLIFISDLKVFGSIVLSLFFAEFGFKLSSELKDKFKIPKIASCFLIVGIFGLILFLILYIFGEILFIQAGKIFSILTNKEFISQKIDNFQIFFDFASEKLRNFQQNHKVPDTILRQIEFFFDSIPNLLNEKISQYSLYLIQKSYIPGLKIFNFVYFLILFLIFSFFIMHDWEKIIIIKDKILGIYSLKIQEQINSFKILISKMLIGQIKVALILFCFYAFFFWIFKFEYYILFSLIFGLLTFVPIIGSILSVIILGSSFYFLGISTDLMIKLSIIFTIGYFLENLYLTPSIVGSSLHVHPLIILIGLILFSKFFGILGMFFALPVTAFFTKIINNYLDGIKIQKPKENKLF